MSEMSMMPGPCVSCGARNYPLSCGGPAICPRCDCTPLTPHQLREERETYEQRIAALEYDLVAAEQAKAEAMSIAETAGYEAKVAREAKAVLRAENERQQHNRHIEGQMAEALRARLDQGPLLSCPWCGESQVGRPPEAQITHLIQCGDKTQACARRLARALVDQCGGRPQCRGCYEYLDKPIEDQQHTNGCWAKQALAAPGVDIAQVHCEWSQDEEESYGWETSCGNCFVLNEGTPEENNIKWCCYCGRPVKQVLHEAAQGEER